MEEQFVTLDNGLVEYRRKVDAEWVTVLLTRKFLASTDKRVIDTYLDAAVQKVLAGGTTDAN